MVLGDTLIYDPKHKFHPTTHLKSLYSNQFIVEKWITMTHYLSKHTLQDKFIPSHLMLECISPRTNFCSQETIQQEVELLETILKENGYPNNFIERYSKNKISASKTVSACKKSVYICLPFKGDIVCTQIKHRLGAAIGKIYYAANLIITYDTKGLLKESNVDKKSLHVTSNCIYQFSCICGSTYIGRTELVLSTRTFRAPTKESDT